MIQETTMYGYSCDHCKELFDDGHGHSYWKEKEDLMEWMKNDEWWREIDGKWYCGNCYTMNEEGEYIVQSIRD